MDLLYTEKDTVRYCTQRRILSGTVHREGYCQILYTEKDTVRYCTQRRILSGTVHREGYCQVKQQKYNFFFHDPFIFNLNMSKYYFKSYSSHLTVIRLNS